MSGEENNAPAKERPAVSKVGMLVMGAFMLLVLAAIAGFIEFGTPPDEVDIAITEAMTKLQIKPRTVALLYDKAANVKQAIRFGSTDEAARQLNEIVDGSKLQNWSFEPLTAFMDMFGNLRDDKLLDNINNWIANEKSAPLPYLLRGKYYYDRALEVRAANFVEKTMPAHMLPSAEYMKLAAQDVAVAVEVNPENPYAHYLLLSVLSGSGNTQAVEAAFQAGISRFPSYFGLYEQRLLTFSPKSGGTPESMYVFTDKYAGDTVGSTPLKLLYVQLYADLLDAASAKCNGTEECIKGLMDGGYVTPKLLTDMQAAMLLYKSSQRYEFTKALQPILSDMARVKGGEHYTQTVLAMAAGVMGAEHYMLDVIGAELALHKNELDNADKKYRAALVNVEQAEFPGEEAKTLSIAIIYDALSDVYRMKADYINVIVMQNAAAAYGGQYSDYRYLKCFAYHHLKKYSDAERECTKQVSFSGSMPARYWRAKTSQELGEMVEALKDYEAVAGSSDNTYRVPAAMQVLSMLRGRDESKALLDALNKYSYLFDEATQSKDTLATIFNERCYAYMQLNELQKALDDCNVSLKYGNLPDAGTKQQELMKRIHPAGV